MPLLPWAAIRCWRSCYAELRGLPMTAAKRSAYYAACSRSRLYHPQLRRAVGENPLRLASTKATSSTSAISRSRDSMKKDLEQLAASAPEKTLPISLRATGSCGALARTCPAS